MYIYYPHERPISILAYHYHLHFTDEPFPLGHVNQVIMCPIPAKLGQPEEVEVPGNPPMGAGLRKGIYG